MGDRDVVEKTETFCIHHLSPTSITNITVTYIEVWKSQLENKIKENLNLEKYHCAIFLWVRYRDLIIFVVES